MLYRPAGAGTRRPCSTGATTPRRGRSRAPRHEIGAEEHERWLAGVLADPERTLLVVEAADGPAGSVRFDVAGDEAEISVVVAPQRRGEGLGKRIVRESSELILAALAGLERVRAEVGGGQRALDAGVPGRRVRPAGDGASPLFLDRAALASRPT